VKLVRCIGGASLIALALLAVPGADRALAAAPSVSIDAPVADSVQQAAFAITGSAHQDGNQGTVTNVTVKLSDDDGWTPPVTQQYTGSAGGIFSGGGGSVSYNWPGNAPKYNGPYTVTVSASGQTTGITGPQPTPTATVSKSFHVEIPPAAPTGVSATMAEGSTAVTVKWNKNAEPDIAGYVVYRSYQGAAGKQIGSVDASKTTWSDDLSSQAPGQYKYTVQAVRHARSCKSSSNVDEACSRGIAGKQSTSTAPVTVRGQSTTTTSTTIKKSGGGGGGSSGGGSTTTTLPGGSSGGSGGSSGGVRTGGAKSGATGGFAPGGEVDLSQFGSLLNPKARGTGSGRVNEPEGTYDQTLPYGERPVDKPKDDNSLITIGGTSIPQPSDDWVKFIGLGSLVTALLVHVLWFKQQVDRLPLEAID
jgi:hypothetical protein